MDGVDTFLMSPRVTADDDDSRKIKMLEKKCPSTCCYGSKHHPQIVEEEGVRPLSIDLT